MMKTSNPPTKIVYQDNSLSSFITGIAFGAVIALMLGTEEGRELSQKLKKNLSKVAKDLEPTLQDLPEKTANFVNTVKTYTQEMTPMPEDLRPQNPNLGARLHRTPGTTFTQAGRPL